MYKNGEEVESTWKIHKLACTLLKVAEISMKVLNPYDEPFVAFWELLSTVSWLFHS